MRARCASALAFVAALSVGLFAAPASAYSVQGGDVLVRPVVGASVNVLRLDVATRETPPFGMLLGVDVDYSFTGDWNVTAGLRPVLAPGFLDTGLLLGAKYRWVQLQAPFIPYASAALSTALGFPLGYGDVHVNAGGRVAVGVDYFVLRDLAVGLEVGAEASGLFTPIGALEVTTDALIGLTWRI